MSAISAARNVLREGTSLQARLAELVPDEGARREILALIDAEVDARTRELASLSAFLQTSVEREKQLLARELHDGLGGILTPAKMDLAWLQARLGNDPDFNERMQRLSRLIDQGIDLKRRVIENLRPSLLDHLGLAAALRWYVDETCRAAGIEPRLRVPDAIERLPADLEIALFRLVQEAVHNTVRHGKAAHVDLVVERTPQVLKMSIADDGVGIADVEKAKRSSFGFAGMLHRVHGARGTFDVTSRPGEGTRIDVTIPVGG